MKRIGMISTAVLSLALGVAAPAFAQQEQRDQQDEQKAKSTQKEEKKAQPEKSAKQEEKPAAHQEKTAKPEEKNAQQQDKNTKNEEKNAQQQHAQQAQSGKQEQRAGGGRIPDDRFKANFGQQHKFRVSQADYSRDRRFQYGGYWFGFVDPWPSNWLYTQDVFVVEINGVYYLCNPMYPGVNIALSFTL
jgi:hypothetical protein